MKFEFDTDITVNGSPGKIADISPGMKVDFVLGVDGTNVTRVTVSKYVEPDKTSKKGKRSR